MRMNLVENATQQIKEMIVAKQYDDSGYLPCEGDLCKLLGVSRTTVREAIRSLEVRGLVKRIHGKGIMVVDNSVNVLTQTLVDVMSIGSGTISDLIEVRNIIETASARLASRRANMEDLKRMQRAVAYMEKSEVMDERYFEADLDFHLAMVHAAKNPLLNAIVEAYIPLLKDTIKAASQGVECIERKYHYHADILRAIAARDESQAENFIGVHLIATVKNVSQTWNS